MSCALLFIRREPRDEFENIFHAPYSRTWPKPYRLRKAPGFHPLPPGAGTDRKDAGAAWMCSPPKPTGRCGSLSLGWYSDDLIEPEEPGLWQLRDRCAVSARGAFAEHVISSNVYEHDSVSSPNPLPHSRGARPLTALPAASPAYCLMRATPIRRASFASRVVSQRRISHNCKKRQRISQACTGVATRAFSVPPKNRHGNGGGVPRSAGRLSRGVIDYSSR